MENHKLFNGQINRKWPCSIAMLNTLISLAMGSNGYELVHEPHEYCIVIDSSGYRKHYIVILWGSCINTGCWTSPGLNQRVSGLLSLDWLKG